MEERVHKQTKGKAAFIVFITLLALPIIVTGAALWLFTWGSEATIRSDSPLSREAADLSHPPLPESASNVYYLLHAEGTVGFTAYLRFQLEPTENSSLRSAIEAIIYNSYTGVSKERFRYKTVDIINAPHIVPLEKFLPMPWWNTKEITQGYYLEEQAIHKEKAWVDTEKNIIYFYQTD